MVDRFTLGKADTVSVCEEQDLIDVEEENYCDMQSKYNFLKKYAYDAFTEVDHDRCKYYQELPTTINVYTPFKQTYDLQSDTWILFINDTTAGMCICPDHFPLTDDWTTEVTSDVEIFDINERADSNNDISYTLSGGDWLQSDKHDYSSTDDDTIEQLNSGRHSILLNNYWHINENFNAASRHKANQQNGNAASEMSIKGEGFGSGGTLSDTQDFADCSGVWNNENAYDITSENITQFGTFKRLKCYQGSGMGWVGAGVLTKTSQCDWISFYKDAVGLPGSYPSLSRTELNGYVVYTVTGTDLVNTYMYIHIDDSQSGVSFTVEHSTTGTFTGEETNMTQQVDNNPHYLYSTVGHAATNTSYIKISFICAGGGDTGNTPYMYHMGMTGTQASDVYLQDDDVIDETTATSFTEQFEDLSEDKMPSQETFIAYMEDARSDAIDGGTEMFLQGTEFYSVGSYFIDTSFVNSTTLTYNAGDDLYYHNNVTHAVPSTVAEFNSIDSTSIDIEFNTGVLDNGVQADIDVDKADRGYYEEEHYVEDDDIVNCVKITEEYNVGQAGYWVTCTLKEADNETEGYTTIHSNTVNWTEDSAHTTVEAIDTGTSSRHKYYVLERTGYNLGGDCVFKYDIEVGLSKKTYDSRYLETITFDLPHDYLYVGLLLQPKNNYNYLSYVTAEYWNGSAWVGFNLFELVDVSAYSTTKLKFTIFVDDNGSDAGARIIPRIRGINAINCKTYKAGRTV